MAEDNKFCECYNCSIARVNAYNIITSLQLTGSSPVDILHIAALIFAVVKFEPKNLKEKEIVKTIFDDMADKEFRRLQYEYEKLEPVMKAFDPDFDFRSYMSNHKREGNK